MFSRFSLWNVEWKWFMANIYAYWRYFIFEFAWVCLVFILFWMLDSLTKSEVLYSLSWNINPHVRISFDGRRVCNNKATMIVFSQQNFHTVFKCQFENSPIVRGRKALNNLFVQINLQQNKNRLKTSLSGLLFKKHTWSLTGIARQNEIKCRNFMFSSLSVKGC